MSGVARGAGWALFTLLLFFGADSLLFRTGWYDAFLEPDSSAGTLENQLYWLKNSRPARVPEVLVIGDSRIAEGFSARVADAAGGLRFHFWNFGMPGTTPRVWYYALRDADPTRRRFADIVIALDKYSDADWFGLSEDRTTDENFLAMRLSPADCFGYAGSLNAMELKREALFECLFRGVLLRSDVQAFLQHPGGRMTREADMRRNGLTYINGYDGRPDSLRGLTIDWAARTVNFPAGVSQSIRDNVNEFVLPRPVPNTAALARYRRRWLGGILDLYKNSATRLIFVQLPRGPLVRPGTQTGHGFVDTVSRDPRVTVMPADTFSGLERPELFADGLHLNRDGRPMFSRILAERVAAIAAGGGR